MKKAIKIIRKIFPEKSEPDFGNKYGMGIYSELGTPNQMEEPVKYVRELMTWQV